MGGLWIIRRRVGACRATHFCESEDGSRGEAATKNFVLSTGHNEMYQSEYRSDMLSMKVVES